MDLKQLLRGVKPLAEMHYHFPVLAFLEISFPTSVVVFTQAALAILRCMNNNPSLRLDLRSIRAAKICESSMEGVRDLLWFHLSLRRALGWDGVS